jgi:hypothetical protein
VNSILDLRFSIFDCGISEWRYALYSSCGWPSPINPASSERGMNADRVPRFLTVSTVFRAGDEGLGETVKTVRTEETSHPFPALKRRG